jgi:hypothetical protein
MYYSETDKGMNEQRAIHFQERAAMDYALMAIARDQGNNVAAKVLQKETRYYANTAKMYLERAVNCK